MNLEEFMLYSLLALIKSDNNNEVENKIKSNYVQMILQTNVLSDFENIISSNMFYGSEGQELFNKGKKYQDKLYKMPTPYEFEGILYDINGYMDEVKQRINYSVSKIDDTFFWKDAIDVIDSEIDAQEKMLFEELAKIDIVTSSMYSENSQINVMELMRDNANDMQEAYRNMLKRTGKMELDPWIISQIIENDKVTMYSLKFINNNEFDEHIKKYETNRFAQNLWGTYEEKPHNYHIRNFKERYLYAGKGRITNLNKGNCMDALKNEVITMFDVSKNIQINIENRNPLKIISDYIEEPQAKFSIKPTMFVEILNMQLLNDSYNKVIKSKKCIICGRNSDNGHIICSSHFDNATDYDI